MNDEIDDLYKQVKVLEVTAATAQVIGEVTRPSCLLLSFPVCESPVVNCLLQLVFQTNPTNPSITLVLLVLAGMFWT